MRQLKKDATNQNCITRTYNPKASGPLREIEKEKERERERVRERERERERERKREN